jgi:GT2 family glycosyltransferase
MLLSVVIPTYRRRDLLAACLEHLSPGAQTLSPDSFEVVVTDDDGDSGTRVYLAENFPWVRHNFGPQKGPACNRNSGARAANGEWLLFLDDDCLPQPDFLAAYVKAIQQHPDYSVFEGQTVADRPRKRLDEEAPINDRGGYLWSCNFAVKRKVFFDIGGFCELYPYACMEDVDFREQLKARSIPFLFLPEATVIHPWRPLAPDEKYFKMRVVSHVIFFERYPALKPSLFLTCRVILRLWVLFLLVDAPRMGFRGFWRYLSHQVTVTRYQFQTWAGSGATQPVTVPAAEETSVP